MNKITVVSSIVSPDSLVSEVLSDYELGAVRRCSLLLKNVNDTYVVESANGKYILRVYRAGWRTHFDVRYELDALLHLHRKSVPVSFPIASRQGEFVRSVCAPEGQRFAVLFTFADGREPSGNAADSLLYGRAVAQIHSATDDFHCGHPRFPLDLEFLIEKPLALINPFLCRSAHSAYLRNLLDRVSQSLHDLPLAGLNVGFCHGDTHGLNAHIIGNEVYFFDFDYCGLGWRAYDLAAFRWGFGLENQEREVAWRAFIQGYTELRPIREIDFAAARLLGAVRQVWLIGHQVQMAGDWGNAWLKDCYFEKAVAELSRWEVKCFQQFSPDRPADF